MPDQYTSKIKARTNTAYFALRELNLYRTVSNFPARIAETILVKKHLDRDQIIETFLGTSGKNTYKLIMTAHAEIRALARTPIVFTSTSNIFVSPTDFAVRAVPLVDLIVACVARQ